MRRSAICLVIVFFMGSQTTAWPQDKTVRPRKLCDGVFAVDRESLRESGVLPLKDGEVLVVNRHLYLKKGDKEPPRFLVVHSQPDVLLDLAAEPKAVKDGAEVVRILLKLRPKAARALEQLTHDRLGKQVAIVVGGEVVTTHKIREVIKGGEVQISSCAAGAANYLLEQLQAHPRNQ